MSRSNRRMSYCSGSAPHRRSAERTAQVRERAERSTRRCRNRHFAIQRERESRLARYRRAFGRFIPLSMSLFRSIWASVLGLFGNLRREMVTNTRAAKARRGEIGSRYMGARLSHEQLEDRRLLATYSVSNLFDTGAGSFRDAVALANANPGADTIDFVGGGIGTINLTSGGLAFTDTALTTVTGTSGVTVALSSIGTAGLSIADNANVAVSGITLSHTGVASTGIDLKGTLSLTGSAVDMNGAGLVGINVDGSGTNEGDLTLSGTTVSGATVFGINIGGGATASADIDLSEISTAAGAAAAINISAGVADIDGSKLATTSLTTKGLLVTSSGDASISGSDLSGVSGKAISNARLGGYIVDASGNWWGSTTAATILGQTEGLTDITPYLNSSTDGNGAAAGFVGDFSTLNVTTLGSQFGSTGRVQEAVNLLANGALTGGARTINVQAGLYRENVHVNKAATLLGANALTAGAGVRGTESIIEANAATIGAAAVANAVISVTASDVTIQGFTVSGDDTTATGLPVYSGVDANALYAITNGNTGSGAAIDGLTVKNNILQRAATGVFGNGISGASTTSVIDNNLLRDIGVFNFGWGISLRNNFYADVTNNVMERVFSGAIVNNYSTTKGSPWLFSNNQIDSYAGGLWHNQSYSAATSLTISGNTFKEQATVSPVPVANNIGILFTLGPGGISPVLTGNTIDDHDYGVVVWNSPTGVTLGASNSITDATVGALVTNNVGFNPHSATALNLTTENSALTLNGASITNSTTGATAQGAPAGGTSTLNVQNATIISGGTTGVLTTGPNAVASISGVTGGISSNTTGVSVSGGSATLSGSTIANNTTGVAVSGTGLLTIGTGNTLTGGTTGLLLDGANVDITGNDLGDLSISGQSGDYITLANTAFDNEELDGSGLTLGGTLVTAMTFAQLAAAGAKITDELDDNTLGLVDLGVIVVTPVNTGSASALDNDYLRIKNAIEAAQDGDTIVLAANGLGDFEFNWNETFAMASWALGNDGLTSTDDDYSILVAGGLDNVTLRAEGLLGSARILGPGDVAGVNLEGFLYFPGGGSASDDNQGWTIRDLEIYDFDLGIGMFNSGAGSDAFQGTQILGNHFRVPVDTNATVDPTDVNQNIGLHYSFGKNQTIQGNTFEIAGGGLSDGLNTSASVGMQSNTSGGDVYDGLLIDANIVNVTGTLSAQPSSIRGLWENAHGHLSDVTFSNNQFNNLTGLNATTNKMIAFRASSHSSGSTTVNYTNNTASGANIGFQLLTTGSAANPINFAGNTLSSVNTGFEIQSGAIASITSGSVTGNSGIGVDVLSGGSVTLGGGSFANLDIGVRVNSGGSASVSGVNFNSGTDNEIDLQIAAGSTVTIGAGNQFGGEDYFIDNASTANYDLTAYTSTNFETLDPANLAGSFAIENLLRHKVDVGNTSAGLIRINAGKVYVTTPGTGQSDESIQSGIDAATAGDTVHVQAGTYKETVTVNKAVTLLGANSGTAGADPRGLESVIQANAATIATAAIPFAVVSVTANNVTIDGFTVSGDDPLATGTPVHSGVDANAFYAIANGNTVTAAPIDGLTVRNNIVERAATGVFGNGVSGASTTSVIDANLFQDIGVFNFGYAVSLRNNFYADITNNVMDRVYTGIITNNFSVAKGAPWLVQGNEINSYAGGLWHNQAYSAATPMTLDDNDFTQEAVGSVANNIGLLFTLGPGGISPIVTNNSIADHDYGVVVWNSPTGVTLVASNTISDATVGALVTSNVGFNPHTSTALNLTTEASALTLDGADISNSATGVLVQGPAGGGVSTLTTQNGVQISGSATGIVFDGANVGLSGLDFNDTSISATGDYITLANSSFDNLDLDATGMTLGGVAVSSILFDPFAAEGKITHEIDDNTLGLVLLAANTVYVTPTLSPTATNNDYTRIKNAVEAVSDGWTIVLGPNGADSTFNWDEPFALASWELGNDGISGTDDDWGVQLPGNLDDVTVTADVADNVNIQGPGDLTTTSFEAGFIVYYNGVGATTNTNWTFSNFGILEIDNAFGLFYTNGNDFSGLTIDNMHILVPADNTTEPNDFQNMGIHYGFGQNISITNNLIEFEGTGTGGDSTGIQSNTHGGASYDGLNISNNTFVVLGNGAEEITGIWENGHTHTSDITISDNTFTGLAGRTGEQTAFVVTSHSSATTTVAYTNNIITDVNTGIEWLAEYQSIPQVYTGTQPVVVSGNTITGVDTGIQVGGVDGSATLSGNAITGASGTGLHVLTGSSITITSGTFQNLDIGILVDGNAAASISGVDFNAGTDNDIDIQLAAGANLVTIGAGVQFGGNDYFIDNASANNFNLTSYGAGNFEGLNPATLADAFSIEDLMRHKVDVGNTAAGLIRVVASELFVTTPGTGLSAETIQNAVDAASDGDLVNVESGTFSENVVIGKDIDILGDSAGGTTLTTSVANSRLITVSGAGTYGVDDDEVTVTNLNLDGAGVAAQGVYIEGLADLGLFALANGDVKNTLLHGVFVQPVAEAANPLPFTGTSPSIGAMVGNVELSDLDFTNNGISGGGGTADIQFFGYNNDATLTNITTVGSRNEGAGAGARGGIQFRGVGFPDGTGLAAMGDVNFNNVDISGTYRNQMMSIQRYLDVIDLDFNGVKLGGATSGITGTFGASLRFDGVGSGSLATPATVDLGDTLFRGLGVGLQPHEIEFAPDNSFAFLKADATGTQWDVGGVVVAGALNMSLNTDRTKAFAIEERILHYVDKLNPTHALTFGAYKGFAEIVSGAAFIQDQSDSGLLGDGSIQRGVNVVPVGGTVFLENGAYVEQVDITKSLTLRGEGAGSVIQSPATLSLTNSFTFGSVRQPIVAVRSAGAGTVTIEDLKVDGNGQGAAVVPGNDFVGIGVLDSDAVIDDVTVTGVRDNPLNGVQRGRAIFVGNTSGTHTLSVTDSIVNDYQKNGIDIRTSGGTITATVSGNTITGAGSTGLIAQNGIVILGGVAGSITGNTVINNEYTGVGADSTGVLLFNNSPAAVTLSGNTLIGNDVGVYNQNSDATIQSNTITGTGVANDGTGVVVDGGSVSIIGNTTSVNNSGIAVYAGNALIQSNNLQGNTIGVLVDGGTVDLGQVGPGTNITGLGVSTGGNNFTGYVTSSSTTGAIVVSAIDGVAGPQGLPSDIPAFGNTWSTPTPAGIEAAVFHDGDDSTLRFVDFAAFAITSATLTDVVNEGGVATFIIDFANESQAHTLNITWGDGSVSGPIVIPAGTFIYTATHTYLDDEPDSPSLGSTDLTFSFTLTDSAAPTPVTLGGTDTITVNNVAPTIVVDSVTSSIVENSLATIVATVTDPGTLEVFDITIDWQDPNSAGATLIAGLLSSGPIVAGTIGNTGYSWNPATREITLTHTYSDDGLTPGNGIAFDLSVVTLGVADDDGGAGAILAGSADIIVNNAAPSALAVTPAGGNVYSEGNVLSFTASATDNPADVIAYSWSITGPGIFGSITGTGTAISFTAVDNGNYTIALTVADDDGASTLLTYNVPVVANTAPTIAIDSVTSSIVENSLATIVATVTDPGSIEVFEITIDWQDPNSVGPTTISGLLSSGPVQTGAGYSWDPATRQITLTHTYSDDGLTPGNGTAFDLSVVTLSVADDDLGSGSIAPGSANITVNNVAPTSLIVTPAGGNVYNEGQVLNYTLSASDVPADVLTYSWTITGPGIVGSIVGSGTAISFTALDDGVYSINASVSDDDLGSVSLGSPYTQAIADVAPTVEIVNRTASITENGLASIEFRLVDPGLGDLAATGAVTINWDDFPPSSTAPSNITTIIGGLQLAALQAGNTVTVTHTYADDNPSATSFDTRTVTFNSTQLSPTLNYSNMALASGSLPRTIVVNNVAPTGVFLTSTPTIFAGNPVSVFWIAQTDTSPDDVPGLRYTYFIDANLDSILDSGEEILPAITFGNGTYAGSTSSPSVVIPGSYFNTPGTTRVASQIRDDDGGVTTLFQDITVNPTTFQVSTLAWNDSGFQLTFNRAADPDQVNLYNWINTSGGGPTGGTANLAPVDLFVTGPGGVVVNGSLVWNSTYTGFDWVKTGGALAAGNYQVTLRSGDDRFEDTLGEDLDGDVNLIAGGDFVSSVHTVTIAPGARTVGVPDFSRGATSTAGQPLNLPFANTVGGAGIPVTIDNGTSVTAVDFQFVYDAALLDIPAVNPVDASSFLGLPVGWTVTVAFLDYGALTGLARVNVTLSTPSLTPLGPGAHQLVRINGSIRPGANYGAGEVLKLNSLRVNEGNIASRANFGVHKAVFVGEANQSGGYDASDAALISGVVVDNAQPFTGTIGRTGFEAYPVTDPIVIADVTRDGTMSGLDASWVSQKTIYVNFPFPSFDQPEIPNYPAGTISQYAGFDPTLDMDDLVLAAAGGSVVVPIRVTDTLSPGGVGVLGFTVGGTYDTTKLDLTPANISLGSLLLGEGNWGLGAVSVDDSLGVFAVNVIRTNGSPTTLSGPGVVLNTNFIVSPSAPSGVVPVDVQGPATTGGGSTPAFSWVYNDGSILIDAIGPKVEAVIIDSTAWTDDFRDYLDGGLDDAGAADFGLDDGLGDKKRGYVVPPGAGQLVTMPWSNINRIKVTFTEDVAATISASDFSLVLSPGYTSANGMSPATLPGINVGSFAYDVATKTASFELTGPLQSTAFELKIAAAGVQDTAGNNLDGEWTTSQPSFPSGTGAPGGDFNFLMLSLPGDAVDNWSMDGYGLVSANDSVDVRNRQNEYAVVGFAPSAGYNSRADLDGNGIINASDSLIVRDAQNAFIAPPPAVVASFAVGAASVEGAASEAVGGQLVVFVPTVTTSVGKTLTSTPAFTGVSSENVDDALELMIDQQRSRSDDDDTVIEDEVASDTTSWDQAIEELLAEDAVLDLAFDWKS